MTSSMWYNAQVKRKRLKSAEADVLVLRDFVNEENRKLILVWAEKTLTRFSCEDSAIIR